MENYTRKVGQGCHCNCIHSHTGCMDYNTGQTLLDESKDMPENWQ